MINFLFSIQVDPGQQILQVQNVTLMMQFSVQETEYVSPNIGCVMVCLIARLITMMNLETTCVVSIVLLILSCLVKSLQGRSLDIKED